MATFKAACTVTHSQEQNHPLPARLQIGTERSHKDTSPYRMDGGSRHQAFTTIKPSCSGFRIYKQLLKRTYKRLLSAGHT